MFPCSLTQPHKKGPSAARASLLDDRRNISLSRKRNGVGGYTYVFSPLTLRGETMQRRPTSFDIAALAGVSQPTVSRALNNSPSVSADTRARVLAAAEQLNYKVDKNASGLRRSRSRTLALLFEEASADASLINPFYLSMLGAMVRKCADTGYDLLISFQQLSSDWHVDYADTHKADGIILLGYGDFFQSEPSLRKLVERGTHFVRWGCPGGTKLGATVGSDNEQGGFDATQHLLQSGRRQLDCGVQRQRRELLALRLVH